MTFSKSEVATYLFSAALPSTKTLALTIIEWNMLVKALANNNMYPESLLHLSENELSQILSDCSKIQKDRIIKKVTARKQLGIAMVELEDLANQGYNVIFRSQMPKRLKKLELKIRPAFYYSVGDINILNSKHTLSVVGSRNAKKEELMQVEEICKQAAHHNIVVISGGAAGVDSTATTAALDNGGRVVIFPSTGIGQLIKNKANRQYVQNGQLLIMSTEPVYARFTGRYAMQRNKFIHSTGDAVLVGASQISSNKKSGTWEGVMENINAKWSPLYTIGQSEGVLELLNLNKAEAFTSLHNIYPLGEQLRDIFEQRLQSVINEGIQAGVPVDMIVDVLQKKIDGFKGISQISDNNLENDPSQKAVSSENSLPLIVKEELVDSFPTNKIDTIDNGLLKSIGVDNSYEEVTTTAKNNVKVIPEKDSKTLKEAKLKNKEFIEQIELEF
ncbi:DNA-processing protein DprA [Solibacillus sp. CAU 1738]|uniref:DNA-processing protein DprA n=1 Tax=Solibacillus sp. CAU 1738 TaxID=3140363 RepID=UPI00326137FD